MIHLETKIHMFLNCVVLAITNIHVKRNIDLDLDQLDSYLYIMYNVIILLHVIVFSLLLQVDYFHYEINLREQVKF